MTAPRLIGLPGADTHRIVYVRPSTSVSPVDGNRIAVACLEGARAAEEPRSGLWLQASARSNAAESGVRALIMGLGPRHGRWAWAVCPGSQRSETPLTP